MAIGLFLLFSLALAFGGGSARWDMVSPTWVRVLAAASIGGSFVLIRRDDVELLRPLSWLLGLWAGVIAVQLIPVPFDLWTALPGRSLYAEAGRLTGTEHQFRPISITPDLTINSLLALLPAVAVLLAAPWSERLSRPLTIYWVMSFACLCALIGPLQLLGGPQSPLYFYRVSNFDSATGLFANRNHNAFLLSASIPLLLWSATRPDIFPAPRRLRLVAAAAGTFGLFASVLVTGSRMGALLGVLGVVGGLVLLWRENMFARVGKRAVFASVAVAVLAAGAAIASWAQLGRFTMEKILQDLRVQLFYDIMDAAGRYFPVGSGFGSFSSVYRAYERPEQLAPQYLNQAHNDLIQIVIEGGLPALLVAFAAMIFFLRWSLQVWRETPRHSFSIGLGRVASIMIGLIIIASATDYPIRTPLFSAILALAAFWLARGSRNATMARQMIA